MKHLTVLVIALHKNQKRHITGMKPKNQVSQKSGPFSIQPDRFATSLLPRGRRIRRLKSPDIQIAYKLTKERDTTTRED